MLATETNLDTLIPALHAFISLVGPLSDGKSLSLINNEGLTLPQILSLHSLITCGPMPVSEVAKSINLSRAATSQMVERLVQAKLVERVEDERDRRHKQVSISPRGLELMVSLRDARVASLQQLFMPVSAATRERFIHVLEEVVAEVSAESKTIPCRSCTLPLTVKSPKVM